MNEQDMAKRFTEWLRRLSKREPIFYLKVHGSKWQRAGIADYWIILRGVSIQIEMKAPSQTPIGTPIQEKNLRDHAAAGGMSFVSNNLDACKAVILFVLQEIDPPDMHGFIKSGHLRDVVEPVH
jgi:hypothetical protein